MCKQPGVEQAELSGGVTLAVLAVSAWHAERDERALSHLNFLAYVGSSHGAPMSHEGHCLSHEHAGLALHCEFQRTDGRPAGDTAARFVRSDAREFGLKATCPVPDGYGLRVPSL
jgi:hypothetical protein